ncbi:MAG: VPLPA-CTERM sorting domain-containing protein [bacterium]
MRFLCLLSLLFSVCANAVPVKWELVDVRLYSYTYFDGLGLDFIEITGSFIYDADKAYNERFTDVHITGGALSDYTHATVNRDGAPNDKTAAFFENDSYSYWDAPNVLNLGFQEALTNAGGTVLLYPANYLYPELYGPGERICDEPESLGCGGPGTYNNVNGVGDGFGGNVGYVVGSAVPIPAAVWLFGSALVGLGWLRRKREV